jgi:hypothetical protein
MPVVARVARTAAGIMSLVVIGACSGAGNIGEVLGGVLGAPQGGQTGMAEGAVRAVDTRTQQVSLQLPDGQNVALGYDQQTKVVYQNQLYAVTNLESGDRVIVRVRQVSNGGYYTDSIHVTQSVSSPGSGAGNTSSSAVQSLQGTVRQIDRTNGMFTIDASSSVVLIVSMPYNVAQADRQRFENLRVGDPVRFSGVFLNNTRVELRRFQ